MSDLFLDPSASVDERVSDLLARMTLDEKIAQIGGMWLTGLVRDGETDADHILRRIPHGIGHITRIGASTGLRPDGSARLMNDIQRAVVEGTRLGIPVVVHEESTGGFCARDATVFPQAIGLASTWDEDLVRRVADAIRRQMVAVGARHSLAPVLDVARDPRWGRVEETYGEDPYLCGRIGTAYVQGLQSPDLREGVIATGKHFLGYALSEGGMNHAPVQLGPRELREVYAEPFAAAIRDADLASIMNSYSSVDGLPCAGSATILDDLLRDELGFDGLVVADYFSVGLLISHHRTAADKGEAAAQALAAGLDVELPQADCYAEPLKAKVEAGEVDGALIDRAAARVLASKVRLGLFERPYVDDAVAVHAFDTPADRSLAREAAIGSITLLQNDGVLPIPVPSRVALIGPTADDVRLLQGDYHYPAHVEIVYETGGALLPEAGGAFAPGPYFTDHITPLAGLSALGLTIEHAAGCAIDGDDDGGLIHAAAVAQRAQVAIVCVGGRSGLRPACTVGEARDATDLRLTGVQELLVREVAATGTPTVVVVIGGRVHDLSAIVEPANAIVEAWCPGEEGGAALAEVIVGRADPGGRLPVTLPRNVGQVPIHHGHRAGGGTSLFYGDYTDSPSSPLFAFGHGLSYADFDLAPLELEASTTAMAVRATTTVTNVGRVAGTEVVQLYARDDVSTVARPDQLLVGFSKVALEPGQSATVTFTVDPSRLASYDAGMRFVLEPGTFTFSVGRSSADIRSTAVADLAGTALEYAQRAIVATTVEVSS